MVIGSGFVRSGSGYVSTPATRAAARAAGTFGTAETTAQRLSWALSTGRVYTASLLKTQLAHEEKRKAALDAKAAADAKATAEKLCPKGNEYRAVYPEMSCPVGYWQQIKSDGLWCVCSMWKSKVPAPTPPSAPAPAPPPAPSAEAQTLSNALRLISVFGKAAAMKMFPWIGAILAAATAIKPKPPTPPAQIPALAPAPTECLSGLYYDAAFYKACKKGYTEYSVKGHNKCVCIAKLAEAKAELDLLYPREEGDGDALGDLGKYTPYLLLAAIAGVVLSLIKR